MSDAEPNRRLLQLACRSTSYALLSAAERGPITRADAAEANGSTPESADLVLRRLERAELLRRGDNRGRRISYELTDAGRLALASIRRFTETAPPRTRGWWVAVKRHRTASLRDLEREMSELRPARLYRCTGDFDLVAVMDDPGAGDDMYDELFQRLKERGARDIAAALIERSTAGDP